MAFGGLLVRAFPLVFWQSGRYSDESSNRSGSGGFTGFSGTGFGKRSPYRAYLTVSRIPPELSFLIHYYKQLMECAKNKPEAINHGTFLERLITAPHPLFSNTGGTYG